MINPNLRSDLEPLPCRLQALPVVRGFPVPWFVHWENGVPEFRAMDAEKWHIAIRCRLCWVCGDPLGKHIVFVAGPMCGINRTSGEPPCHLECAQWSARNCPFLSKPQMARREGGLPDLAETPAGFEIARNPGVTMLWVAKDYSLFKAPGGILIRMGEPVRIEWYALGKPATRAQVEESVRTGLPSLEAIAAMQDGGLNELRARAKAFESLYPKE